MPLRHSAECGRISRRVIAATGRTVVVWLAVAMIASAHRSLDTDALLGVSIAAAIWIVALRAAFADAPYVLGAAVPARDDTIKKTTKNLP